MKTIRAELLQKKYATALSALSLAIIAHHGQQRNDGSPFVNHPIQVARYILAHDEELNGYDADNLIAIALLHDTIEDTVITFQNILDMFWVEIATTVFNLSKYPEENKQTYYKKVIQEELAIIIKILDRHHNLETSWVCKPERHQRFVEDTLEFIIPMYNNGLKSWVIYNRRTWVEDIIISMRSLCYKK